jgi:hypothetical protein
MPRKRLLRWIRISRVHGAALAALAAGVVALPIALTTLELGGDPRRSGPNRVATTLPEAALPPAPSDARVAANRAAAESLRQRSSSDLAALVRESPDDLQRMAALHVLWTRGERDHVETLVAQAHSRELDAKLAALRARTK